MFLPSYNEILFRGNASRSSLTSIESSHFVSGFDDNSLSANQKEKESNEVIEGLTVERSTRKQLEEKIAENQVELE